MKRILVVAAGLAVVGAVSWLVLRERKPQTLSLPDGSRLTLLKVTYGTNHVCRYDNRWQDLLYPILPPKLRAKFPPRVMTFASGSGDTTMVWLRHERGAGTGDWPPFSLAVGDENGLESRLLRGANATRTLLGSGTGKTLASNASPAVIGGWELRQFPRRAGRFKVWIYRNEPAAIVVRVGELAVHNRHSGKFPTWTAEPLPATQRTNELEITLTKLETGLTGNETGHGPAGEGAKSFSRATFTVKENGVPTENWSACGIGAGNAAGEVRPKGSYGSLWQSGEHNVNFAGGLWLEEAAWKLEVDFARTGDFPPDELWVIKDVRVPTAGQLVEMRLATNIHARELEFLGVSGPEATLPEGYNSRRPYHNVHVRSPYPLDDLRVLLVAVRDNRGLQLQALGYSTTTSTGGRGNTPKEMLHGFAIEIPEDAKSLDITLAATRVRRLEFLAKPVMFEPHSEHLP